MAPPGRRKMPAAAVFPLLVITFLSLFTATASAATAVLGIDLGTEFLKAAVAKPGSPIDIVLTKDSKRKEAATLAFKPSRAQKNDPDAFPERLYGGDAIALSARYPADVFPNIKTLLGLPRYNEQVKEYGARYPGLTLVSVPRFEDGNARGTVGFKSLNIGEHKESFMVEELLAMQLKNLKANAEAAVGKGTFVTDAVITYPSFYTADEKRAVELAAELAGLRLLGMVSDGLAVGLNYATTRTFDSISEGGKPEYHLVYDMGAGSTSATVLKFQGRTVKDYGKRNKTIQEVQVLGTGYDRTLGGDALSDIIVKDMVNQLVESDKMKKLGVQPVHIKQHAKTMARLWKEAGRIRQVLSANPSTSASLDGLYYDDVKFKYSLSREHFEKLAKGQAGRVTLPLTDALDSAGVTLKELDSIILHGGAVRTPFVEKQLEAVAGGSNKIKRNVNADEAAVMGAAFRAAGLSSTFRVKDIRATDLAATSFSLKWAMDGKEKNQKVFTPSSQLGVEKQMPFKALEDIAFEFSQAIGDQDIPITAVVASNLTKSAELLIGKYGCVPANISTVFNIRLNPANGLPEIVSGSVSCKAELSKGGVMDNVKGMFGFGSKKETAQQPLEGEEVLEDDPSNSTPLPVDDPTSSGTTISQASPTESGAESSSSTSKSTKSSSPTPSTVTIPLALKTSSLGLNRPPSGALPRIKGRLSQFDASDRNTVLRSEALNTLEAYTYRARDYLTDESFIAVSTEKAREELEKQLSAASDWLYGDGYDAKLQEFKHKLKSLTTLVDPVLKRKDEISGRKVAIQTLKDGLENMSSMIKMVEGNIERAAQDAAASFSSVVSSVVESVTSTATESQAVGDDLEDDPYSTTSSSKSAESTEPPVSKPYEYTQDDLSSMTKMYDSVQAWLSEKLALQEKLSPSDDPAVLISELEAKAQQLQSTISDVIMKTIKMQEVPKKPKKTGKKTGKAKGKKGKADGDGANSTTVETKSTASATTSKKDEL